MASTPHSIEPTAPHSPQPRKPKDQSPSRESSQPEKISQPQSEKLKSDGPSSSSGASKPDMSDEEWEAFLDSVGALRTHEETMQWISDEIDKRRAKRQALREEEKIEVLPANKPLLYKGQVVIAPDERITMAEYRKRMLALLGPRTQHLLESHMENFKKIQRLAREKLASSQ